MPEWHIQLRPLFSHIVYIDLLRLRIIVNSCDDYAGLLGLFATVSSIRLLSLCFASEPYLCAGHNAVLGFDDTLAGQLRTVLLDVSSSSAFHTLHAVDLVCYFDDAEVETLLKQRGRLSAWAARALS